jgi:PadR family transcriptional regulator PadR
MNLKGTLSVLILQVLKAGPKHGYLIAKEIRSRSEGVLEFGEGTLYPALHAHENHGLIESHVRVEGGRRRRYYRLTEAGERVLDEERAEWRRLVTAVDVILGEA